MKVENLLEGYFDPKFGKLSVPEKKSVTKAHRKLVWWDHNDAYDYGWFARDPNAKDHRHDTKFFGKDADAALKFAKVDQSTDLRSYKYRGDRHLSLFGIPPINPDYHWEAKHGGTAKEFVKKIKEELAGKTGDWQLATVTPGDMMEKHKQDAVTVELMVKLGPEEVAKALKSAGYKLPNGEFANSHRLYIQTEFALNPPDHMKGEQRMHKQGSLTVWLDQAGQFVSIGYSAGKFNQGDLDSFINALKKACKQPLDKMVAQLYKSGLNHYGRA